MFLGFPGWVEVPPPCPRPQPSQAYRSVWSPYPCPPLTASVQENWGLGFREPSLSSNMPRSCSGGRRPRAQPPPPAGPAGRALCFLAAVFLNGDLPRGASGHLLVLHVRDRHRGGAGRTPAPPALCACVSRRSPSLEAGEARRCPESCGATARCAAPPWAAESGVS